MVNLTIRTLNKWLANNLGCKNSISMYFMNQMITLKGTQILYMKDISIFVHPSFMLRQDHLGQFMYNIKSTPNLDDLDAFLSKFHPLIYEVTNCMD